MCQIVGYVTKDEARAFRDYADSLGLDVSALANLLIRRELQLNRLGQLPVPPADKRDTKITAHIKDEAIKVDFTDHTGRHGLQAGPAATRVFRAELEEHWLEVSLAHIPF